MTNDELKDHLVKIISENLGQNTGKLYKQFYHSENPQRLLMVADNMLSNLLGHQKSAEKLSRYYQEFSPKKDHA